MKRILGFAFLLLLTSLAGFAFEPVDPEVKDAPALSFQTELFAGASTGGTLPFWLYANKWGAYEPNASHLGNAFSAEVCFPLPLEGLTAFSRTAGNYDFADGNPESQLNNFYGGLFYKGFYLLGGTIPLEKGEVYKELSSGSLILSSNARPIPRLYFGLPDFSPVPYTGGYVEVKGSVSHGWLGGDRYVKNPYLHEKDFFVRLSSPWGLRAWGGLIHEVIWAGTHPTLGDLPDSFGDFYDVIFGGAGGDDAPYVDQINKIGDHKGAWDFGLDFRSRDYSVKAYYQHFFEDASGMKFRNRDWKDGLWGLVFEISPEKKPFLKALLYEHIDTTWQGGCGDADTTGGRDYYYEHSIYKTSWINYGRVFGNPLFTVSGSGSSAHIVHSRIKGHHMGLSGFLAPAVSYKVLLTYYRSFGTYADLVSANLDGSDAVGNDVFEDGVGQFAGMMEVRLEGLFGRRELFGSAAVGFDFGDLRENSVGIMLQAGRKF